MKIMDWAFLKDFIRGNLHYIAIYLGFLWTLIIAFIEDREFKNSAPGYVFFFFVLWQILAFLIHSKLFILLSGAVAILISYGITIHDRQEYNDIRERLHSIRDEILERLGIDYGPPTEVFTPRMIASAFNLDRKMARELYDRGGNAFATLNQEGPMILFLPIMVKHLSDDAIAFVFLHELGHILLGHLHNAWKKERQGTLGSLIGTVIGGLGGALLGTLLGGGIGAIIGAGIGGFGGANMGRELFFAHYSRQDEREADIFGAILAQRLGYDISRIMELMDLFEEIESGGLLSWLWEDHPPARERKRYISEALEDPSYYWEELSRKIDYDYLRRGTDEA